MDKVVVSIFGIVILFMLIAPTVLGDFEKDLFWSRNDDTIVLTNSSHNVMIGKNDTTAYKLEVDGQTLFNGSVFLNFKNLEFGRNSGDARMYENIEGIILRLGGSDNFTVHGYGDTNFIWTTGYPNPIPKFIIDENGNSFISGELEVGSSASGEDINFYSQDATTYGYIDGDVSSPTENALLNIFTKNARAIRCNVNASSGGLPQYGLFLVGEQHNSNQIGRGLFASGTSYNNANAVGSWITANTGTGSTGEVESLLLSATNSINQQDTTCLAFESCLIGDFLVSDAPKFSFADFDLYNIVQMQGSNPIYGLWIHNNPALNLGGADVYSLYVEDNPSYFGDAVTVDKNLTIPYVPNGYDMSSYTGNICINQSTGLLGTKDNDDNWYWR